MSLRARLLVVHRRRSSRSACWSPTSSTYRGAALVPRRPGRRTAATGAAQFARSRRFATAGRRARRASAATPATCGSPRRPTSALLRPGAAPSSQDTFVDYPASPTTRRRPELPDCHGSTADGTGSTVSDRRLAADGGRLSAVEATAPMPGRGNARRRVPLDDDATTTLRRLLSDRARWSTLAVLGRWSLRSACWLVRVGLRPLDADRARPPPRSPAGDLSRRVEHADDRAPRSAGSARALNAMLGQIEDAFDERTRVRGAAAPVRRRRLARAAHAARPRSAATPSCSAAAPTSAPTTSSARWRGIEAEAERMGVLVDDLLLLARLDQGRPLEREPVDLAQRRRARPSRPRGRVDPAATDRARRRAGRSWCRRPRAAAPGGRQPARERSRPTPRPARAATCACRPRTAPPCSRSPTTGPGSPPTTAGRARSSASTGPTAARSRRAGGAGLGLVDRRRDRRGARRCRGPATHRRRRNVRDPDPPPRGRRPNLRFPRTPEKA